MSVAASLVVRFGEGADSTELVAMEFDAAMNLDAAGEEKREFSPGDPVFFLVHHAPTLRIGQVKASCGMVVAQGAVSREKEQQLLWTAAGEEQELSYVPASAVTPLWYGNVAAGLRKTGLRTMTVSGGLLPALSLVRHAVTFHLYKLLTPPVELGEGEEWPITIVAWMEEA